jgi:hypothetical protein
MIISATGGLETPTKPRITIDSFKIRILKRLVNKAPEVFNIMKLEEKYVNIITGDILTTTFISEDEDENEKLIIKKDYFSNDNFITQLTAGIEKQVIDNIKLDNGKYETTKEEFYTFKITSKLLKDNYFNGIDYNTIKQIYEYILSIGFDIEFNNFIKSELTDIDYKFDITLAPEVYKSIAKQYDLNAKEWKELYRGLDKYNQKNNQGISFGIRERATPSYPFMKVYNKELESKNKSFNFFNVYSTIIDNLYRWEFTIKNKKHFDYLELNNTLESHLELVEFNQGKLWELFNLYHNIHLNKITNTIEETLKKEYKNMNEIVLSALVEKLIKENDFGYTSILNYFETLFENTPTSSKYRMLNKVKEIYNNFKLSATGKKKIEVNEETENVMKLIGIL